MVRYSHSTPFLVPNFVLVIFYVLLRQNTWHPILGKGRFIFYSFEGLILYSVASKTAWCGRTALYGHCKWQKWKQKRKNCLSCLPLHWLYSWVGKTLTWAISALDNSQSHTLDLATPNFTWGLGWPKNLYHLWIFANIHNTFANISRWNIFLYALCFFTYLYNIISCILCTFMHWASWLK